MAYTQQSVNAYAAAAVAGDIASQNPVIYLPYNCQAAGTSGVKVGSFVWHDSTSGAADNAVVNAGSGKPLGFVPRDIVNPLYPVDAASMVVPTGGELAVAVLGDFYMVADASATVGAVVYANTTTGAATLTSTGAVDTGFRVVTPGSSGDRIIISAYASIGVLGIANGGIGLSSLGTAGQILKVNSGGTAIEWANA